ncbi:MAG: hypothetical protein RIR26_1458 [Pseudomonadota bacterium]
MFTEGTRQFGTWKNGHPSVRRYTGRPTQALLLSYGLCAFVTWLIFILTLKLRGEFFLVESMNLPLHFVSGSAAQAKLEGEAGVSLALQATGKNDGFRVVFDTGESFLMPEESTLLSSYLTKRTEAMEVSAILQKRVSAGFGTAALWVDRRISFDSVAPVSDALVRSGFDTLAYAVESAAEFKRER